MRTRTIKLSPREKSFLRRKAVLLREEGKPYNEIGALLGVHPKTVTMWYSKYLSTNKDFFEAKPQGRRQGYVKIGRETKEKIINIVENNSPEQVGLFYPVWSKKKIVELIRKVARVKISERTIGNYLNKWFFPSSNLRTDFFSREDQEAVAWISGKYSSICKKAKQNKGIILWINNTIYKPHNETRQKAPLSLVRLSAERNNKELFFVFQKDFNQETLIQFCESILRFMDFPKIYFMLKEENEYKKQVFIRWLNRNIKISYCYLPKTSSNQNLLQEPAPLLIKRNLY